MRAQVPTLFPPWIPTHERGVKRRTHLPFPFRPPPSRGPPAMTVTLDTIRAAAERIQGQVERTPCRYSRTLSEISGAEVWVKFDNLQFTASFKERGALNKLLQLTEAEKKRGVIAASAGNHAQGLAYHGQRLGVPVTIVMPRGTPTVKVEHTRGFGAEVIMQGETYDDAGHYAREVCTQRDLVFVHAF